MTVCGPALTAKVAGATYDLNDGQELRLLDYDLGLAPVRRLSQRAPEQEGDTDLGFRVDPRFVDLFWAIHGRDVADYRAIRGRLMEVFTPREEAVQIVFDFGDGLVRALDVHLDGELAFAERIEAVEKVSGVFKASDPRLYDPEMHTKLFNLEGTGGSTGGWEIPWEIPWQIGADTLNLALNVLYAGGSRLGAPEFPIIRIFGPIEDPVISNETTGEVLNLSAGDGLSLSGPSEWVEIDLAATPRRDAKTLRDQDGNSVDEFLTTDSDLATWHLAPAGERLPGGNYATGSNVIRVMGSGVTPQTLVTMRYFDRYVGV